jgi:hypothetical protein
VVRGSCRSAIAHKIGNIGRIERLRSIIAGAVAGKQVGAEDQRDFTVRRTREIYRAGGVRRRQRSAGSTASLSDQEVTAGSDDAGG